MRSKPGLKADINIIDFDTLRLHTPEVVYDLPAGGRRVFQTAEGYVATIVSGEPVYENGTPTGAMPGRLVRGSQPEPASRLISVGRHLWVGIHADKCFAGRHSCRQVLSGMRRLRLCRSLVGINPDLQECGGFGCVEALSG